MQTILVGGEAIGLTVGSLFAATLFCWAICWLFKALGLPKSGPMVVGGAAAIGLISGFSTSLFVHTTLLFVMVVAGLFWIADPDLQPPDRRKHR